VEHRNGKKRRSSQETKKRARQSIQKNRETGGRNGFFIKNIGELLTKEEKLEIIKSKVSEEGISINRACELLQIPRSSIYYKKRGESDENKKMMEIIEEEYSKYPTHGYRRMTEILRKKTGKPINKKRVRRLMKKLGLKGIFPKMEKMELKELKENTEKWVRYYNSERLHQALGYRTQMKYTMEEGW